MSVEQRQLLLWDESDTGETKEDAPVETERLMERVLEKENSLQALKQVKRNGITQAV